MDSIRTKILNRRQIEFRSPRMVRRQDTAEIQRSENNNWRVCCNQKSSGKYSRIVLIRYEIFEFGDEQRTFSITGLGINSFDRGFSPLEWKLGSGHSHREFAASVDSHGIIPACLMIANGARLNSIPTGTRNEKCREGTAASLLKL